MIEVYDRLYVGKQEDCKHCEDGWITIHLSEKCFGDAWMKGNLDPFKIFIGDNNDLYVKIHDPPTHDYFCLMQFKRVLSHIETYYHQLDKKILIHCHGGTSRSASMALLFMCKRLHLTWGDVKKDTCEPDRRENKFPSSQAFYVAQREYQWFCQPNYEPTFGIGRYLEMMWDEL